MRFWKKCVMTCMACDILEGVRWKLYYKTALVASVVNGGYGSFSIDDTIEVQQMLCLKNTCCLAMDLDTKL
jgi:hypothetical protein